MRFHNVLVLFVVLVSASPELCSRTRKGTVKIKGIEKIPYKKKEVACNSTPSLFPVSWYFMSTITFCGQNARTMKLLERIVIYELSCWLEVVDHWAGPALQLICPLCKHLQMMPFAIVQRLYQIPAENGQVFLWRFPSPTLQELPQPWHKGSTQRQLGWIVCIVGKRGDLDVGMPFVSHLGKE